MRRRNPYSDTMAQDMDETPHVRLSGWDCQTKLLNAACSVGECVEANKSQEFSEQQVIGASMTVSRWQQPHKEGHVTGRRNPFTHPNTITQACSEAEAHPPTLKLVTGNFIKFRGRQPAHLFCHWLTQRLCAWHDGHVGDHASHSAAQIMAIT